MINYTKLTDTELDNRLLIAFFPSKKERINFSDREIFLTLLYPCLDTCKVQFEFAKCLFDNLKLTRETPIEEVILKIFLCDEKIIRMSALQTYDENKEEILMRRAEQSKKKNNSTKDEV